LFLFFLTPALSKGEGAEMDIVYEYFIYTNLLPFGEVGRGF
jgi:hypothetical protein